MHLKAFMSEHEQDGWFLERYDPNTIFQTKMQARVLAQARSAKLLESLPVGLNLEVEDDSEVPHCSGPPHYDFDANARTILLKQVPVYMTAREITNQVNKVPELHGHLEELSFSDPLKMHQFERFAWLTFDTEEVAAAALEALDGVTIRVPESFEQ